MSMITAAELALWQRSNFSFTLLDVRRAGVRAKDGADLPAAQWLDPALWLDWKDGVVAAAEQAGGQPVVLACAHGHEISQGLAAALRAMGADARSLAGGYSAWKDAGLEVVAHGSAAA
jgi:thiosulfate sulfurtransferase